MELFQRGTETKRTVVNPAPAAERPEGQKGEKANSNIQQRTTQAGAVYEMILLVLAFKENFYERT